MIIFYISGIRALSSVNRSMEGASSLTGIVPEQKLPGSSQAYISGVDLNDLTATFSEALGLVGKKWYTHGKRVAVIALQLSEYLSFSSQELEDLRLAALLHDIAVSSPENHEKQVSIEWEGARKHCLEAAALLEGFPYFERITGIIRRHHDKWSHLAGSSVDEKIALSANLVFLADQIDLRMGPAEDPLLTYQETIDRIVPDREGLFNPQLIELLKKTYEIEAFWLPLDPRYLEGAFNRFKPNTRGAVTWDELESAAIVLAGIVDKKSPFTADHSFGVARLCHYFATQINLMPETVQKLRIAGLMHDIGKLAVPNEILEKPSSLTPEEFHIVKQHPYGTYLVLSNLPGLNDVRDWAAFHHEKGDGSGYPFHLKKNAFGIEHLIVMFSDIIRALIQRRPYRSGLSTDHIIDILEHLTANHSGFSPLTKLVRDHYGEVEAIARGKQDIPLG